MVRMEVKVLLIQNSKMHHPSKVRMKVKKDAIESILRNHGYDPMTHCEIPEQKVKKKQEVNEEQDLVFNVKLQLK